MDNDTKHDEYLEALFNVVDTFFRIRTKTTPPKSGRPKKYSDALILKLMFLF